MYVKPLEKISAAYGLNSLKAYLEGEQNLKWITRIIGSGTAAREMLSRLAGYVDRNDTASCRSGLLVLAPKTRAI
jgi:hypothetical protein